MGIKHDENVLLPHHKDYFLHGEFMFGPFLLHGKFENEDLEIHGKLENEDLEEGGEIIMLSSKYDESKSKVLKLHYLGFPSSDELEFIGSCNGLVCLYDRDHNQVSLWNPLTRQFRNLPKPKHFDTKHFDTENGPRRHLLIFGFDVQTKDYNVMLLTLHPHLCRPLECICKVQVYTSSTDSWRLLEGISYLPGFPFKLRPPLEEGGLYLNGTCFFMAEFLSFFNNFRCFPESDRFIISLDLTKQIITPIQLPDHHRDDKLYLCYFGDDKIALFTAASPWYDYRSLCKDGYEDFNIWVLNYDDEQSNNNKSVNKNSWTHFNSFRIQISRRQWNLPRGISNDGKYVMLQNMDITSGLQMKLYNLVTKEVEINFLPRTSKVTSRANAYKPSLEPIPAADDTHQEIESCSLSVYHVGRVLWPR